MTVRRRGAFGHACVLGTTTPEWAPGEYATPIMGCSAAGQHVWGALSTAGGRGLPIRHFMNEAAVRLLVYDCRDGEDLRYHPAPGYSGLCEVDDLDDQWGIWQPGRPPKFAFTTAGERGRWREHGVLDVEFGCERPALQFACPDPDEPLAYLARIFRVSGGHYLGEPVRDGYVFHEQVYLRSGQSWALSGYKKRLQGLWVSFVTRYTDGTSIWGQICRGAQEWSFAILIPSAGEPILSHRPGLDLSVDADGLPRGAEFDLGPHGQWTWRPRPGGRIPLPGPGATTPFWCEGVVERRGDDRTVAFAHTWWESYRDRLEGRP